MREADMKVRTERIEYKSENGLITRFYLLGKDSR